MDVSVFRTLKEHWKKKVHEWRLSNLEAPVLKKKEFPKLLKEVIDNVLQVTILENGFRKCGLFPWNPEAITLPLNIEGDNQVTKAKERGQFLKEGLRFLNESIPESKLKIFCNRDTNKELEEKDISLFELWQKTKLELESNLLNASGATNEPDNLSIVDGDLSSATLTPSAIDESTYHTTDDYNMPSGTNNLTCIDKPARDSINHTDLCQAGTSKVSAEIPSPFKRHFFFQKDKNEPKQKRSMKEKMPAIVSGQLCQDYFRKKLAKKEELEKRKLERAAERQRKKDEKERAKQDKVRQHKKRTAKRVLHYKDSSNSGIEEVPSDSDFKDESDEENIHEKNLKKPVERKVGEYVVFSYEEELFPGVITDVCETAATITAMKKSGRLWKWPEKEDKLDYEWETVLYHIDEPLKMSTTRNVYSVPELEFLWD